MLVGISAVAGEFPKLNTPFAFIGSNYIASAALTNTTPLTFTNTEYTPRAIYTTFHLISSTTGSNTITAGVDRSIDGNYWFTVTNSMYMSSNTVQEVSAVGKWTYWRIRWSAGATNGFVQYNVMTQ